LTNVLYSCTGFADTDGLIILPLVPGFARLT